MSLAPVLPKGQPHVTVVVPIYNRTMFIGDAVRSLLAQTWPVYQIVLVDDGSGEETCEEARRLAGSSDRIEFHHLPFHRGAAAARNKGLDLATGDYILFLDDDDVLHPRMLEASLALFESDPSLDVVTCLYEMFFTPDGSGPWCPAAPLFNYKLLDKHPLCSVGTRNAMPGELLERTPFSAFLRHAVPIHTCLIRRASIGGVRFPEDLKQGEDTWFWLSLARRGCKFKLRGETHAYIRRHSLNATRRRSKYYEDIGAFYRKILAEGMVDGREEAFLIHFRLALCEFRRGDGDWITHCLRACCQPGLLLRQIATFARETVRARRNLLRYYFLE
jgi:glycosyltransferase involved in cell wall biosynthesis